MKSRNMVFLLGAIVIVLLLTACAKGESALCPSVGETSTYLEDCAVAGYPVTIKIWTEDQRKYAEYYVDAAEQNFPDVAFDVVIELADEDGSGSTQSMENGRVVIYYHCQGACVYKPELLEPTPAPYFFEGINL
ncbi:MAG: hypothetical protein UU72_C0003G0041 [candidate division WWE3 bacterium GW2011_GWB1_41_6]|uniref:Lipoprotein n=2 Tax=Katanobacteria TaxID=422282 RepID=A0A1F4VI70_UNCKA|nr:MAG: hypothetical protein UU72_C0003G0041 [candidate division WWE3 bacterium GW2011_GWB1_41_6]OGC56901.1 MAG: hypothetical protein A2976_00585 [candidate division WWE3 bacterium RIFCSPLOWO2_01_FULL_41_9]